MPLYPIIRRSRQPLADKEKILFDRNSRADRIIAERFRHQTPEPVAVEVAQAEPTPEPEEVPVVVKPQKQRRPGQTRLGRRKTTNASEAPEPGSVR